MKRRGFMGLVGGTVRLGRLRGHQPPPLAANPALSKL